ncbi:MAG: hypothetical protein JKX94_10275 [Sneathiella sp.]|nr:hypothetical protein [Sneathiella sp.]
MKRHDAQNQTVFGGFVFCCLLAWLVCINGAIAQERTADTQPIPSRLVGHGGPIKAITLSRDGKFALTASFDYSIIYWQLTGKSGQPLHRLIGHTGAVNDVAFFDNETKAVSVSDDGSIGIWDLTTGSLISRLQGSPDKVLDVKISPDEQYAAIARWDQTARLINLKELREEKILRNHRGNVNSVEFSNDGEFLYTAANDGVIRLYSIQSGDFIRPLYKHGWGINVIELSSDGRTLFFGSSDGTLGEVNIAAAKLRHVLDLYDEPVLSLQLSTDGSLLAVGGGDGIIHVYDALSAKEVEKMPAAYGPIWDLDFTPAGRHIYHVGLDDFALHWQVSPAVFKSIQSKYPRRFQVINRDDLGEIEFQRKCSICHTLHADGKNRAGPTLFGLFGRKAGTVPGYRYSDALLKSRIIWNERTIGQLFDEGPDILTPGSKMPVQRLKNVERRDELINFLKRATNSATQEKEQ